MVKGRQCSVYVDLATQAFPCIKFWILQEHLRDIRDDPEVLDPPKLAQSASASMHAH